MTIAAEETTEIKRLRDEIRRGTRVISLGGLTSIASKAFVLSNLQAYFTKTFVIVADSNKDLENWDCDLDFFQSKIKNQKSKIEVLPSFETDVYSGVSPHAETLERRALTLWNLTHEQPDFLILSAKSLVTKTVAPKEMLALGAVLRRDADFPPEDLIEKLVACGYVREEPIKNVGEFSVRGGILDVWSPTAEMPVRIEFFGDTVDSIRQFDAETQLSIGQLKEISIAPMREFAARSSDFNDWAFFARERFADDKQARAVKDRTDFAAEGESFSGWEFLLPLVKPRAASVFEYLKSAIFVIDEPTVIEQSLGAFYETLENRYRDIAAAGEIGLMPDELFLPVADLREKITTNQRVELRALGRTAAETDEQFQFQD
jgi:transcription-repair coupling factor (superfamily II helicase)